MIATWPCLSLDPHPSELFKSKKHADFCFSISVASLHMDFLHVSGLSKKNSIPPLKKNNKKHNPSPNIHPCNVESFESILDWLPSLRLTARPWKMVGKEDDPASEIGEKLVTFQGQNRC